MRSRHPKRLKSWKKFNGRQNDRYKKMVYKQGGLGRHRNDTCSDCRSVRLYGIAGGSAGDCLGFDRNWCGDLIAFRNLWTRKSDTQNRWVSSLRSSISSALRSTCTKKAGMYWRRADWRKRLKNAATNALLTLFVMFSTTGCARVVVDDANIRAHWIRSGDPAPFDGILLNDYTYYRLRDELIKCRRGQ